MSNKTASNGGIGFFGMMTVLFIGLKLTGNIDWSWLWVLSPIWLPVSLVVMAVIVAFLIAALMDSYSALKKGK